MFCPQCRAEYRPGFHRCADCDVDLVDSLRERPAPNELRNIDGDLGDLRIIWVGASEIKCADFCRDLLERGVPYKVAQKLKSLTVGTGAEFRYARGVSAEDEKRAKEFLGLPEAVVEDAEYAKDDGEEGDQAPDDEIPEGDYVPENERRRASYLKPWYPEDATIEVWTQPPPDGAGGLEMALKENQIRSRVELQEDGSRKYFVLPEDEADAREIIREISEDSPPR